MEVKTESVDIKYEIGQEIGKGKFATVKRCRDRQSDSEYAAKFIRKNRGAGRRGAKMENIEKEIQILSETNHRNIINLYEVYDTKREVILILELVDGGELFEYLSEKDKLCEEEASSFVRQILDGVEHLHSLSIAHLDLKPENILLQDKNSTSVKLIDFGLSRKILPKEDHRAIMGTAEFCAPEVISFEPLSVSTDMWSIGVITYVLLSGLSPFLGDNQQETYHNITSINFEFDEEYFNGTSELAKDFIKKLLVRDTRKRATIHDCLNHPWIQPVEKHDKVLRRSSVINTEHLKKFIARQRWKRSMKVVSLCNRLSRSMQLRRIQSTDTLGSASEEDTDDHSESVKQDNGKESIEAQDKNTESGDIQNKNTESGDKHNKNTESGEIQDKDTESGDIQDKNTESGEIQDKDTESGDIQDKNTEFGDIEDKNAEFGDIQDKITESGDKHNKNTESGEIQDKDTESGDIQDKNTESGDIEDKNAGSGDIQDKNTKSGDKHNKNTNSGEIQDKNDESGDKHDKSTEFGDIEDKNAESGDIQDKDTESGDKHNKNTDSGEIQDKNTESGEIQDKNTVSGDKHNKNTDSGEIQDKNTESEEIQDKNTKSGDIQDKNTESCDIEDMNAESGDIQDKNTEFGDKHDENTKSGDIQDKNESGDKHDKSTKSGEIQDKNTESDDKHDENTEPGEIQDKDTESVEIQDKKTESCNIEDKNAESGDIQDKNTESCDIEDMNAESGDIQDKNTEFGDKHDENTKSGDIQDKNESGDKHDKSTKSGEIQDKNTESDDKHDENTEPGEIQDKDTESVEIQDKNTKSGDIQDKNTESCDIEDMNAESGDIQDKNTEFGDKHDENTKSGDIQDKNESGDKHDKSTKSGEIQDKNTESDDKHDENTEPGEIQDKDTESVEIQDKKTESCNIEDKNAESGDIQDKNTESVDIQDKNAESGDIQDKNTESGDKHDQNTESGDIQDKNAESADIQDKNAESGDIEDKNAESGEIRDNNAKLGEIWDKTESGELLDKNAESGEIHNKNTETGEIQDKNAESGEMQDKNAESGEMQDKNAESGYIHNKNTEFGETHSKKAESGEMQDKSAEFGKIQDNNAESGEIQDKNAQSGEIHNKNTESIEIQYEKTADNGISVESLLYHSDVVEEYKAQGAKGNIKNTTISPGPDTVKLATLANAEISDSHTAREEYHETSGAYIQKAADRGILESVGIDSIDKNLDIHTTEISETVGIEAAAMQQEQSVEIDIDITRLLETAESSCSDLNETPITKIDKTAVTESVPSPLETDGDGASVLCNADIPMSVIHETESLGPFYSCKTGSFEDVNNLFDRTSVIQGSGMPEIVTIHNPKVIETEHVENSQMQTSVYAEGIDTVATSNHEATGNHNPDDGETHLSNKVEIPQSVMLEKPDTWQGEWQNFETGVQQPAVNLETDTVAESNGLKCNIVVGEFDEDIGQCIKRRNMYKEYKRSEIIGNGSHPDEYSKKVESNKGLINFKYSDGNKSSDLLGKFESFGENGLESQLLHSNGMSVVETENDRRSYDSQPLCDEELAYSETISCGINTSEIDTIAEELVSKVIGLALDQLLRETTGKESAFTDAQDLVSLQGQQPGKMRHVKLYDPLNLACFEVDEIDDVNKVDEKEVEGIENDEVIFFKPITTSKFILPARMATATPRRLRRETKMKKKATFWEMEDFCDTERYEMFEMQVLTNSE